MHVGVGPGRLEPPVLDRQPGVLIETPAGCPRPPVVAAGNDSGIARPHRARPGAVMGAPSARDLLRAAAVVRARALDVGADDGGAGRPSVLDGAVQVADRRLFDLKAGRARPSRRPLPRRGLRPGEESAPARTRRTHQRDHHIQQPITTLRSSCDQRSHQPLSRSASGLLWRPAKRRPRSRACESRDYRRDRWHLTMKRSSTNPTSLCALEKSRNSRVV